MYLDQALVFYFYICLPRSDRNSDTFVCGLTPFFFCQLKTTKFLNKSYLLVLLCISFFLFFIFFLFFLFEEDLCISCILLLLPLGVFIDLYIKYMHILV